MAPRPCITCGTPTTTTRCPRCESAKQRTRNTTRTHLRGDWPRISRATIQAHIAEHGEWCPGWGVPPHPAPRSTLTTDHVQARDAAHLAVLCRSCNSRKGASLRGDRGGGGATG